MKFKTRTTQSCLLMKMNFYPTETTTPVQQKPRTKVDASFVNTMTEEELEHMLKSFAVGDRSENKTWTRIVVERFLMNYAWYFPRKDQTNGPSLSNAWAYYEHITLPRHFVGDQNTGAHMLRRCEPGEIQETELYHPFKTRSSSFVEWGLGVDLYFFTLRIMAVVLLMAGLIHLPNLIFYRSKDYSPAGKGPGHSLTWSLYGSAVCTTKEWVACDGCKVEDWEMYADPEMANGLILIQRRACNGGNWEQGIVNWIVLLLLTGVLFFMAFYLGAREVRADEDKVTATDYTVVVKNPPPDAYDPDEWRNFFDQFAAKQVTAVTVCLNNEQMLRLLVARRVHRNNLRLLLPKEIDMEDEDAVRTAVDQLVHDKESEPQGFVWSVFASTVLPVLNLFNIMLPPEVLVDRVFKLTEEIKKLQMKKYDVSRVFVTFETEEGQRNALQALSIGRVNILTNHVSGVSSFIVFKDRLLHIDEPAEPSAIRWLTLSASRMHKVLMRVANFAVTIGVVTVAGLIVSNVRENFGSWVSAPLISVFNTLIPLIVKILMIFEPHSTEGSFQTSLYLKITLFRWVNTALLTKLISPWTSTLAAENKDVLPQINAVLVSELWLVPILRLLDLWGNFQKHYLAPRARTQEEMNLSFQGTKYNLGERYTDLTKVLFVCFFYSSLYPVAFFFGTAILIVQYHVDKFCLMRIWANSPFLGSEVARFSRRYFFSGAVVAYAVVSSYLWAGFPYDNLCQPDQPSMGAAMTYLNVELPNKEKANITVDVDEYFQYCDQSWRGFSRLPFPPIPSQQGDKLHWMTKSQQSLTRLYGYTAVVFVSGYLILFFGSTAAEYFLSWFRGVYTPQGQMQHIDFSSRSDLVGYIPQIREGGFPFPFLACDIDRIDQSLIGWNDSSHSYDYYNLIFDVPVPGMFRNKIISSNTRNGAATIHEQLSPSMLPTGSSVPDRPPIFSIVAHYPPEWALNLRATLVQS